MTERRMSDRIDIITVNDFARGHTPCAAKRVSEQRCCDAVNAQEFHEIRAFVAACRRLWPGAMIVLRPDGAPTGASASINPKPSTWSVKNGRLGRHGNAK
jgi:hypothetical protein